MIKQSHLPLIILPPLLPPPAPESLNSNTQHRPRKQDNHNQPTNTRKHSHRANSSILVAKRRVRRRGAHDQRQEPQCCEDDFGEEAPELEERGAVAEFDVFEVCIEVVGCVGDCEERGEDWVGVSGMGG